jgi:polysaccharide biosynthesis transport protein
VQQYELNLRDYLRIFRKRRIMILLVFVAVSLVSFFYTSRQEVSYEASATVKIEERKTIAGLLTEMVVYNPGDIMESETRAIKSFPVIRNAALRLGKIKKDSPLETVNEVVSGIQDAIDTERIKDTNMITISTSAESAKEAVELVNIVAEAYIEEDLVEKAKQARHSRIFIEEQLASLEGRLRNAEDKLRQLGGSAKEIMLSEATQKKLFDLETELSGLLQRYTEKHPSVMRLREQIKDVESQVTGYSGEDLEYSRLEREVDVNKKLYAMLKEKLEEARISEAEKVSDVAIVNPAVMSSVSASGNERMGALIGMVMGLILGLVVAFVLETLDTSIGTIEDVENIIKLPVLGLIPSLESEATEKRGIWSGLKHQFFPSPKTKEEERSIRLVSHYKPSSPAAEAFRNIQTNIKLDQSRKTILITSSGPREGKTNVAINLSLVMAQSGKKVLLVSADLRKPVLAPIFGLKREPGLNELIMGTVSLDESLKNVTDIMLGDMKFEEINMTPGMENLSIMPSGRLRSHTMEFLGSKKMTDLIAVLKAKFDVIILDTPPVLPVTDTSLLAPKADCAVIVYEIGRTSREALLRTKIQLESTGAKIIGVVLNNTRPQTEEISSYPYRHYRKYYGTEERDSKKKS